MGYWRQLRAQFQPFASIGIDPESGRSTFAALSGTIIRVHTNGFDVRGYTHHATPDAPQYEIKCAKTDHIAFHMGSALTRLAD
jgi:hypothetical protein